MTEVAREWPELAAIWLFGSQATGRARPDSDTDVAVLVEPRLWPSVAQTDHHWRRRLTLALMRTFETSRLDLMVLNEAPLVLAHRVLKDGRLLLCPNPAARVNFQVTTLSEYLDMLPLWNEYMAHQRSHFAPGGQSG